MNHKQTNSNLAAKHAAKRKLEDSGDGRLAEYRKVLKGVFLM